MIIPVIWLLLSHRRAMHNIGSYLQAFNDERALETRWETRVEAFRQQVERSHALGAVPGFVVGSIDSLRCSIRICLL